jgi:Glyoxalase superfamily protein/Clp amino terminal domain, pathogenicity island component
MRDFRDAKAMAHTLRAALAAKGHKITVSESLELIAKAFGVADWNTLSAAVRAERSAPRNDASLSPGLTAERLQRPEPQFSRELESTLHRALAEANRRKHEYATLEHLLLALIDDPDASGVMKACKVDLGALKKNLANYIDNKLRELANAGGDDARPTAAFSRVMARAVTHTQWVGRAEITGANVLVGLFSETKSPAVRFLGEQGMTREDAINFIVHGIAKGGTDTAA